MSAMVSYQPRTHSGSLAPLDTAAASRDMEKQAPCSPGRDKSPKSVCRQTVEELSPAPSLRKRSLVLFEDSDESRRSSSVLTRLSSRYGRRRSSNSETLAEHVQAANESFNELQKLQEENEFRHLLAVQEGRDFLYHFAKTHFESHMDHISITNTKSIGEIKMIGNEELSVGVQQCRRLFNAPVISDEMGLLLWQELRQGDALDHSHEEAAAAAGAVAADDVAPEERRRQRTAAFEEQIAAWHTYQQRRAEHGTELCEALRSRYGYTYDSVERAAKPGKPARRPPPKRGPYPLLALPVERRALDGFLNEVKRRTARSAGTLAATLAAGYQQA